MATFMQQEFFKSPQLNHLQTILNRESYSPSFEVSASTGIVSFFLICQSYSSIALAFLTISYMKMFQTFSELSWDPTKTFRKQLCSFESHFLFDIVMDRHCYTVTVMRPLNFALNVLALTFSKLPPISIFTVFLPERFMFLKSDVSSIKKGIIIML